MKKFFLLFFLMSYLTCGFSKVYDCFTFFNEYDLLNIRFNELYDEVDFFVIVENPLTFTGNAKPLYFAENKQKYEKFLNKIIHIVGPERKIAKNAWERENKQRNDILLGLQKADDSDVIIITDLDEIVKKEKIKEIKQFVENEKEPVRLAMKLYRFFINRLDENIERWSLGYACSYKTLKKFSPQFLRVEYKNKYSIDNAGWHFTSLGWVDNFVYKLNSWPHTEKNTKHNKKPKNILKKARKGKLTKIDSSYPKFIVENLNYFRDINFIDDNYPIFWNIKIFNKRQEKLKK